MRNECLAAALRELDAVGVRDVVQVRGGKHWQLRWQVNGHGLRIYSVPGTPSDWRSPHNVRAEIRRLLREDGLLVAPERPEPAPPSPPPKIDRLAELEQRMTASEDLQAELKRRVAMLEEFIRMIQTTEGDHGGSRQTSK